MAHFENELAFRQGKKENFYGEENGVYLLYVTSLVGKTLTSDYKKVEAIWQNKTFNTLLDSFFDKIDQILGPLVV